MKRIVRTELAPAAVGPYSQAVEAGGLVWVSGQIALDPATGTMMGGSVEDQARRCIENLKAVLEAAGSGMDRVVKTTVYLVDMGEFTTFNGVYEEYFSDDPPARACVEVTKLPKGARVEIDAVALTG